MQFKLKNIKKNIKNYNNKKNVETMKEGSFSSQWMKLILHFKEKKRKKKTFFPCFNFIQWPKLWFFFSSFLSYVQKFSSFFLLNFKEMSVCGGKQEEVGRHKEKWNALKFMNFLLMVKLDSFKVVISWIIPYLMEHGILFNIII